MTTQSTTAGGWTPYHPLTQEDQQVFNEATQGLVGVIYTPQSVSTQVVVGVNYRYKCAASIPQMALVWDAVIEIYQPIGGRPFISGIIRI